jgi:hypothetical protein
MKYNYIIFFFLISSCSYDVHDNYELKYYRFEEQLFSLNDTNINIELERLRVENKSFFKIFEREIIQKRDLSKKAYEKELLRFVNHPDMREAYDSVKIYFNDISDITNELNSAFSIFVNYFPSYELPDITTFFGGFNYGVITYENNIAIGLENFLGKSSKYYKLLANPNYLIFQRERRFISPNVMEAFYNMHFQPERRRGDNFLSEIIQKGKTMYFIDKLLPEVLLRDKFRFSKPQMNWAIQNEFNVWTYFIENDLLYSNYEQEYRSYLNLAPFSKGMNRESPSRIAYYIGYKIIESYMKNNDIPLQELVIENNCKELLKQSKYKPRK